MPNRNKTPLTIFQKHEIITDAEIVELYAPAPWRITPQDGVTSVYYSPEAGRGICSAVFTVPGRDLFVLAHEDDIWVAPSVFKLEQLLARCPSCFGRPTELKRIEKDSLNGEFFPKRVRGS